MNSNNKISGVPHDILVKISAIYPSLKTAEKKAADFFLSNPDFVSHSPITAVADRAGCSEPTFLRLARKLGYEGYTAFKEAVISSKHQNFEMVDNTFSENDNIGDTIHKVFSFSIQTLEDTVNAIDEHEIVRAIRYIKRAKRIIFYGVGIASYIAGITYNKFSRAGIDCISSNDIEEIYTYCALANADDVVFLISHSGTSNNTVNLAKYAKAQGLRVIALTNYPMSPLAKNADIILLTASFYEHFDNESLSNRISELCMIESIFTAMSLSDNKMRQAIQKSVEVRNQVTQLNKKRKGLSQSDFEDFDR